MIKIEKVLIVVNTSKEESTKLSKEIAGYLSQKQIKFDFFNFDGFSEDNPIFDVDLVITLGGDGTVLFAARNCVQQNIPVFPVNLGQFGFIASVNPGDWKSEFEKYLSGNTDFQERMLLKADLIRDSKTVNTYISLNDIVISAANTATTIALDVKHYNERLCRLKGDGVIISTPTGSTAYSASAGGPIVDPLLEAIVLTPKNAFSLSSRPIVLNAKGILEITIQPSRTDSFSMIVDGKTPVTLKTGDIIKIQSLDKKIELIGCSQLKFYNALRSKLNWRGEPHA